METILARSAMSMGSKIIILVAEGSRRLRSSSLELPWETRIEHLNRLSVSMKWAGYNQEVRSTVVTRVLARYDQNITNYKESGRPLYRSREQRTLNPKKNKAEWFRDGGATATVTVPCTPGS